VVVLAGRPAEGLLTAVGRSANVTLIRPEGPGGGAAGAPGGIEAAAAALRRAAGITSPYVLVAADPLAAVAAEWQAMWEVTGAPRGSDSFELLADEAIAAWRANLFELPDYYLVLASGARPAGPPPGPGPHDSQDRPADFYLGPLRALRPHRVAVIAASEPGEQAAGVGTALGSLRHGRWWPPLPEVIDAARRFYPGAVTQAPDGAVPLLG
jgi:hypothetical protein